MSGLRVFAVEDRKADAVTHLADARSQNTENGILGTTKDESSYESSCLFFEQYRKGVKMKWLS